MIPDIGLMVGCYIITRMVSLANREEESIAVKIFAGITILATAFALFDLLYRGTGTGMPQ